jgi:hypothetical protein
MKNALDVTKICSKCKAEKPKECFSRNKSKKDELCQRCKDCEKERVKGYNDAHKEEAKVYNAMYRKNHFDICQAAGARWNAANKDFVSKRNQEYNVKNRLSIKLRKQKNKDKVNARVRERTATDPNFKLKRNLRRRLSLAMAAQMAHKKPGVAIKGLGCSIQFLMEYLESKFLPGMTWDNHSYRGWHVDHITPLSWFDLSNEDQFATACHYTNLQPLWWYDNFEKHDKL